MNLEIKKLSPELTEDYLYFFDNIAFTDNEEWAGCYCVDYQLTDTLKAERDNYNAPNGTSYNRDLAFQYIENNLLQGYLAYADGSVVGWCNANDKSSYPVLSKENRPELWEDFTPSSKVKTIVCFTIAPNMRRQGISTQLLNRVCKDASSEGYTYVEAYPETDPTNMQRHYHGPSTIYARNGFSTYKELGSESIVRKYL
ncbi:MAG: GNAT family N-acetyltransferase [Mobilitalea sp.]